MIALTAPWANRLRVRKARCRQKPGFTLVELIAVLAIGSILSVIASTALGGIRDSGNLNSAVDQITSVLNQARSYAMAKKTFVYVGFTEVDGNQSAVANPQVAGNGRVVMAALATNDGTPGFDASSANPGSSWSSSYNNGNNLTLIHKPFLVDGIHFPTTPEPSVNQMVRPTLSSTTDLISSPSSSCQTPLSLPLGSPLGGGQFNLNRVIYFDPQGATHIQGSAATSSNEIDPYLEVDVQPTHGNAVAPTLTGNLAAIQIDGMTGTVRTYRP